MTSDALYGYKAEFLLADIGALWTRFKFKAPTFEYYLIVPLIASSWTIMMIYWGRPVTQRNTTVVGCCAAYNRCNCSTTALRRISSAPLFTFSSKFTTIRTDDREPEQARNRNEPAARHDIIQSILAQLSR